MHKSVGAAGMHMRVLEELSDMILGLIFDIFRGKLLRTGKK